MSTRMLSTPERPREDREALPVRYSIFSDKDGSASFWRWLEGALQRETEEDPEFLPSGHQRQEIVLAEDSWRSG
ncbi:MAG TPA: hypothetical protein VKS79_25935 [Gemmataceae bacterium]|nr:hypothetical protein [Gemmataceae bacterium]